MSRPFKAVVLGVLFTAGPGLRAEPASLGPFRQEVGALQKAVACTGKTTPASPSYGLGALWGCIKGRAETAKLFVNERPGTGYVENVKVMWNDWYKDRGYGVHADRAEARAILDAVLTRYAPSRKQEVVSAFFANSGRVFQEGPILLRYSYRRGPAIDERLLVIARQ